MKKLLTPLVLVSLITIIFGTIYGAVQQSQRAAANEPQIQLAQDTARALKNGAELQTAVSGKVDAKTSLAPFIIIYDKAGKPVAGNGYVNNRLLDIPKGVLTSAEGHSYNAVTWQPQADVRLAAVSVATDKYYVVSARSLTEVENQESTTIKIAALGWLLSLGVVGVGFLLKNRLKN